MRRTWIVQVPPGKSCDTSRKANGVSRRRRAATFATAKSGRTAGSRWWYVVIVVLISKVCWFIRIKGFEKSIVIVSSLVRMIDGLLVKPSISVLMCVILAQE